MTFESYARFFLSLLLLFLLARIALSASRGRLTYAGDSFRRDAQPVAYWTELGLDCLTALLVALALAVPHGQPILMLAVIIPVFIRHLITRDGSVGGVASPRRRFGYWAKASFYGLFIIVAIAAQVDEWRLA